MIIMFNAGDIESMPFIEALRQFQFRVGKHPADFSGFSCACFVTALINGVSIVMQVVPTSVWFM